jgi:hypothetical protein
MTGAVSLAGAIASFLSASLVELNLERIDIQLRRAEGARAQRHCTSTPPLRRYDLDTNDLGEGGGRALAETCMGCARGYASVCVTVQM